MRAKSKTFRISVYIAIISFVILFFTTFLCYDQKIVDWIEAISAGVFTSAFTTSFILYVEYIEAKRNAIEAFCLACWKQLDYIKDLSYYSAEIPADLIAKYCNEKDHNDDIDRFHMEETKNSRFYDEIRLYIWNNIVQPRIGRTTDEDNKNRILDNELDSLIDNTKDSIDILSKEYIHLSRKLSLSDIDLAFGNVEYLCDKENKYYKEKVAYSKIRLPIRDMICTIIDKASKLEKCITSDRYGSTVLQMKYIFEIQEFLFDVKDSVVFKRFLYDIERDIFILLRNIYGKDYKDTKTDPKLYELKTIQNAGKFNVLQL